MLISWKVFNFLFFFFHKFDYKKKKKIKARDLGKVKKLLNPYCVILLDGVEKTTTTTKPKSVSPFWGQEYVFE